MTLHFTSAALLAAAVSANPFLGKTLYVNPSYQEKIDKAIASADGTTKSNLEEMRKISSAYWIDTKAKLSGEGTDTLEGILKDASTKGDMVTLVVYDLPNRDCHRAKSSYGEICCNHNDDGTCNYDFGGPDDDCH